jgi:hypothetical protein
MRVLLMWMAALALFARPALTETPPEMPTASPAKDAKLTREKASEAGRNETRAKPDSPSPEAQIQQLRDLIQAQARELEAQRAALREQQERTEALERQLHATPMREEVTPVAASVASSVVPMVNSIDASQGYSGSQPEQKSPLSFRIGTADFYPGGFLDFTTVFRSTNVGSGLGTSFGSIPFNNTQPQASLTETRFSAQNSRVSLKVTTKAGKQDVLGYVETDFLGFQPPNANVTSNSNSLRMRLYWVDVKRGGWEVLGGQSWSLLTPNRVGLSSIPSDIFYTQNMDTNYQVGLTWARQTQIRVVYHASKNWAIGVSAENPQQFVPSSVAFPSAPVSFATQFDNGSGSTSAASSGTNPATPNLHPDIIVKTAFDGLIGERAMHVEVAGLLRSFKVLNSLRTPNGTDTLTGGGGSINVNLELIKNLRFIGTSFYSYGGGRYIFGLGPDVVVRPDGRLSGIHSGAGITGFEYQATPQWLLYSYYGGAYFQRNFGFVTPSSCVGFGAPVTAPCSTSTSTANTANRAIQEGTIGLIQTLWKNPSYGALQIITQYSYLTRSPWSVTPPTPKNAHASLAYVDLRYVLP